MHSVIGTNLLLILCKQQTDEEGKGAIAFPTPHKRDRTLLLALLNGVF
ncbi:hypothetical protein [Coleofasciculus sp. H7-2]